MTKILGVFLLFISLFASFGQGTVNFNNRFLSDGVDAPVYQTQVGGVKLSSADYLAQLWAAPVGSSVFTPIGAAVPFRTGAAAGYVDVGTEASRTIPFVNFGELVQVQIRAWTPTASGFSFSQAYDFLLSSPSSSIYLGNSPTLTLQLNSSQLLPPKSLVGLQSFAIVNAVPEPAHLFIFGACGAAALYIFRRR